MAIKNLNDANEALLKFVPDMSLTERPYSLDRMRSLMSLLKNPQNGLRIIHVAGTSGKTSTSYFTASLLKTAGKKVGLTVSPHIDKVSERVQIDLQTLPDIEYCALLDKFLKIVRDSKIQPSYFEVLVAFAFWVFNLKQVDYAVVEVGLGGLLDGTNVIDRTDKICVITDIGIDHTKLLGNTLEEIAKQKAGIITNGNTVLMNAQKSVIENQIREIVKVKSANLIIQSSNEIIPNLPLPPFHVRNFNLAIAVYKYLLKRDELSLIGQDEMVIASQVLIPARMEVIKHLGKTIVLDGSHNEQKLKALKIALQQQFPDKEIDLLVSMGINKIDQVKLSLRQLRKISDSITITKFRLGLDEYRSPINPATLEKLCHELGFEKVQTISDPTEAFNYLSKPNQRILVITGSFYLLNHIRPLV